jgi:hypothetical protein
MSLTNEKNTKIFGRFLNKCGIIFDNIDQLNHMIIPRENLLSTIVYQKVKEDIPELKQIFSSSKLTSLHKFASEKQQWPLLNIVRQILKSYGYLLKPIRKSDGYNEQGKKKIKRLFLIQKIQKNQNIS